VSGFSRTITVRLKADTTFRFRVRRGVSHDTSPDRSARRSASGRHGPGPWPAPAPDRTRRGPARWKRNDPV